jgi:hypothetical protein
MSRTVGREEGDLAGRSAVHALWNRNGENAVAHGDAGRAGVGPVLLERDFAVRAGRHRVARIGDVDDADKRPLRERHEDASGLRIECRNLDGALVEEPRLERAERLQ